MNFFIDFEATQFSNGIISVGCIAENGNDMFYTLVHSDHRVTKFITDLTGIREEEVEKAPEMEIVFEAMEGWVKDCLSVGDKPHFYCYGNCDKNFVKSNFLECKEFDAASMLAYLYTDMEDLSHEVKVHFGLCQNIGIKKVYDYYMGTETIQTHNALEDAKMLREVYLHMKLNPIEFDVFPEYQNMLFTEKVKEEAKSIQEEDNYTVHRIKNGKIVETYPTMAAAVQWCYEQIPEGEERNKTNLKTIARGIRRSNNDKKKKYRNFRWLMVRT